MAPDINWLLAPGIELLTAFAVSLAGCGLYRPVALRWRIVDIPNERSSHAVPTPKGGGVGLVLGLAAAILVAAGSSPWPPEYVWLLGLTGLLALAGIVDDGRGVPVAWRLALYGVACCIAVWVLRWPLFLEQFPEQSPILFAVPLALLTVYALWLLNLFNFMDGIDGLAAAEAVFVCTAAALLALLNGGSSHFILFCLLTAAACLGFLCWNWAPARLFLGDSGSVPLGFLLAALSLVGVVPLHCWLILLAVFVGDASFTLVWRVCTGQNILRAHRLHAYQRLSRHWNSHERVVWAVTAFNALWLAPLALLALYSPKWAVPALVAAYLPLLLLWLRAVKLP